MPIRSPTPPTARARLTVSRRPSRRRSQGDRRSAHAKAQLSGPALRCRSKFLRYYPKGFFDADYLDLERGYKWTAHERWSSDLSKREMQGLLRARAFSEIAA